MCKALSDDELLAKCGRDEPITSEDLGVSKANPSGLVSLNEGLNILTYNDHSEEKK